MRSFLTVAAVCILAMTQTASAADPVLPFQGRLTDTLGAPVTGQETLTVSLYTDQDGTTDVWRRAFVNVPVDGGYFSLELQGLDTTGRALDVAIANSAVWVGVSTDGLNDLQPRSRMASVARAQVAEVLIGDIAASNLRPGMVVATQPYTNETIYSTSSTSWSVGPTFTFDKQVAGSHLYFNGAFPYYIANGSAGWGLRMQWSLDNSTWNHAQLPSGPANGWGAGGYGGNSSGVMPYVDYLTAFAGHTGTVYFRFEYRVWNGSDTLTFIAHPSHPKRATWVVQEIAQ